MDRRSRRAWNLRRLRVARGWTLKNMSEETGIHSTFITDMELGEKAISIRTVDRLADALQSSPSQVLAELDAPVLVTG